MGPVVRKAAPITQKGTPVGLSVDLVEYKFVQLVQRDNPVGYHVDLVGCKVVLVVQTGNLAGYQVAPGNQKVESDK